jgi:hypothetical protein|nr:MAG TPA: hypothetical protein [Caudoviricetes sp.]
MRSKIFYECVNKLIKKAKSSYSLYIRTNKNIRKPIFETNAIEFRYFAIKFNSIAQLNLNVLKDLCELYSDLFCDLHKNFNEKEVKKFAFICGLFISNPACLNEVKYGDRLIFFQGESLIGYDVITGKFFTNYFLNMFEEKNTRDLAKKVLTLNGYAFFDFLKKNLKNNKLYKIAYNAKDIKFIEIEHNNRADNENLFVIDNVVYDKTGNISKYNKNILKMFENVKIFKNLEKDIKIKKYNFNKIIYTFEENFLDVNYFDKNFNFICAINERPKMFFEINNIPYIKLNEKEILNLKEKSIKRMCSIRTKKDNRTLLFNEEFSKDLREYITLIENGIVDGKENIGIIINSFIYFISKEEYAEKLKELKYKTKVYRYFKTHIEELKELYERNLMVLKL